MMNIKRTNSDRFSVLHFILGFMLMSMILGVSASATHAQSAAWKPEKNVEVVVPAGTGGGHDRLARTIQMNLQNKRLIDATSNVVNKPGGDGSIALAYINQHPGDGHYICLTTQLLLTSQITGNSSISYTDVTPIAKLLMEYIVFAVRTDSPIKTGKELVEKLKKDPKAITYAVSPGRDTTTNIAMIETMKAAGVETKNMKVVVQGSAGEGTMALLGGHIDLLPTSAANVLPLLKEGKVRLLAIGSPKRLAGPFAEVPTWKEQGVDVVSGVWRIIVGPKGLSEGQLQYWDGVFGKLNDSEEWDQFTKNIQSEKDYLNSRDTKKFVDAQYKILKDLLIEIGMAK